MQKNKQDEPTQIYSQKNFYQYRLDKNNVIIIDSNFDNGNIRVLKQISQFNYRLEAVSDTKIRGSQKKSWFYFRVRANRNIKVRFTIQNVGIYGSMYQSTQWAKPYVKQNQQWKQLKDSFLSYRDEVILVFDYLFANSAFYYFCLTIPHTYDDHCLYLDDLQYRIPQEILYTDNIIVKTEKQRNCHMLTLTSKQYNQNLQGKKPIILITARVHPGEVSSSYCLMGIIDMLLRWHNPQSQLLLKLFEFVIFPLVNPDGVYQGNYRMDSNCTNLNRTYSQPSPQLHPTIFQIKQQITKLKNSRIILFQFDLHSHSGLKPAFIYGNAYDDIVIQTESQLFCKLLENNSEIFKYSCSQFGQKHMKSKDKGEEMSKQGCARVVISKMCNILYSYTIETSIFPYPTRQQIQPVSNQSFKFGETWQYQEISMENLKSRLGPQHEIILDNMIMGQNILITVLDILQKNPYSRLKEDYLQLYRKQISQQLFQNQQRFKLVDTKAYQKIKGINQLVKKQMSVRYPNIWEYLAVDVELLAVKWPTCMKWLAEQLQPEKRKMKTENNRYNKNLGKFENSRNFRKSHRIRESLSNVSQRQQPSSNISQRDLSKNISIILPNSMNTRQAQHNIHTNKNPTPYPSFPSFLKLDSQQHSPKPTNLTKDRQLLRIQQNIIFHPFPPKHQNNSSVVQSRTKQLKTYTNSNSKKLIGLIDQAITRTQTSKRCEDKNKYAQEIRKTKQIIGGSDSVMNHLKKQIKRIRYTEGKKKGIKQEMKLPQLGIKGNIFAIKQSIGKTVIDTPDFQ